MLEYKRNDKGEITKDGHTMFPDDVIRDLERLAYLEDIYAKGKESIKCKLDSVDFEENYVQIKVPQGIMLSGFHAGYVRVDFSGVQD